MVFLALAEAGLVLPWILRVRCVAGLSFDEKVGGFRNTICYLRGIDWQVGCKALGVDRGRARGDELATAD